MNEGEFYACEAFEFFGFVEDGLGVHCLHSQDLVVALLVVEHGGCEVIENVLGRERTVCLDPFVPYEETVAVVVCGMQVVKVHCDGGRRSLVVERM